MSTPVLKEVEDDPKSLIAARRRKSFIAGIILFLIGVALPFIYPQSSWGTIGTILGLLTIVMVFLRDYILDVTHSRREADLTKKKRAFRIIATYMYAIAVPIIIVAAIYQFIGNPVLELRVPREKIAWFDDTTGEQEIDGPLLNAFRQQTETDIAGIEAYMATLWYPDLRVVNCDTVRDAACACPAQFVPVPEEPKDKGLWDLNSGVAGPGVHGVRLCYRNVQYPARTN